jgi:hypothetical protein
VVDEINFWLCHALTMNTAVPRRAWAVPGRRRLECLLQRGRRRMGQIALLAGDE